MNTEVVLRPCFPTDPNPPVRGESYPLRGPTFKRDHPSMFGLGISPFNLYGKLRSLTNLTQLQIDLKDCIKTAFYKARKRWRLRENER